MQLSLVWSHKMADQGDRRGGGEGGFEVDEASLERLNLQIQHVMRKAMVDLLEEGLKQGSFDHVLRLWKEVRERLLRLSRGSEAEIEKTKAAVDCEYAEELVQNQALDNSILGDMIELASRRIGELGAVAYEAQVLEWGAKLADEIRASGSGEADGEKERTPANILAHFFDTSDVLLTRVEAGVAAHLLCQALLSHPGLRAAG